MEKTYEGTEAKKAKHKTHNPCKDGGVCAKCGKILLLEKTTIDHLIPKYRGGTDEISNLIPMCKHCNKQKGSRIVKRDEVPYLDPFYSIGR